MKGIILDRLSFDRGDINLGPFDHAPNHHGIEWTHYDSSPHELAGERIRDGHIVVTNKVRITADDIAKAPNLKLILLSATGTDNVDLDACKEHGVVVCNARGYSTPSVVQHVYSLILNLATNMISYQAMVKEQAWQKSPIFCLLDHPIQELEGKRLGIIGYGTLGKRVAEVGRAFGMEVSALAREQAYDDSDIDRLPLDDLLIRSDVLSIHCPLTPKTKHLIGKRELELMKPDSILINTARGAIVDSEALITALHNLEIGGAGIDVLDIEPPDDNHPLISNILPNLIVTPHNAWATAEARQRLLHQMTKNLESWIQGAPVNVVN